MLFGKNLKSNGKNQYIPLSRNYKVSTKNTVKKKTVSYVILNFLSEKAAEEISEKWKK